MQVWRLKQRSFEAEVQGHRFASQWWSFAEENADRLPQVIKDRMLSGGVEALIATKPRPGEDPVIVSLARGTAHRIVVTRLRRLFGAMHLDLALELGAAACVLLAAAADLLVRFNVFLVYPFKLATLCRAWFPSCWRENALKFLHEREENLDVGVGWQLHRLAWAKGTEVAALNWLLSLPVQEFMCHLCEETLATSLDVERRLGEVKQWEQTKRTDIATASRNMVVVRFAKRREKLAGMHAAAVRKLRKAEKTTVTALAWQRDPS